MGGGDRLGFSVFMRANTFYNKSCSSMRELEDGCIDLIIAGPPYGSLIDYSKFARGQDHLEKDQPTNLADYFGRYREWFKECFRVLRGGRFCVVNIGTIVQGKRNIPLPFYAVPVMEELGFVFQYDIVWYKVVCGRRGVLNFIQRPYPGNFIPNNRTEYLLFFKKDPALPFQGRTELKQREEDRVPIDRLFTREIANSVWHVMPASVDGAGRHPCAFPPELPYRLISLLSQHGETVLDPFMGIGTTARAAKALGRKYVGYEVEAAFVRTAKREIRRPLALRKPIICRYTGDEAEDGGPGGR